MSPSQGYMDPQGSGAAIDLVEAVGPVKSSWRACGELVGRARGELVESSWRARGELVES